MSRRRIAAYALVAPLVGLLCLIVAGCEPSATPLPAYIPSAAPATLGAPDATLAPVRYALDVNARGAVSELEVLQSVATVEQLAVPASAEDLGVRFDIVAAYGERLGWELSPVLQHVALVINPENPPFDDPAIADALRRSLDPEALAEQYGVVGVQPGFIRQADRNTLKVRLANAGWPDGVEVVLANIGVPGAALVAGHLRSLGVQGALRAMPEAEARRSFQSGRVAFVLLAWTTTEMREAWVEIAGEENVVDLYSVPISYLAVDGLETGFTPGGWPLPAS